jgi:hypothetical protein
MPLSHVHHCSWLLFMENEMNSFEHAAANANPECPKCHGTGSYTYDQGRNGRYHGTICNVCCKHDLGYWLLLKHYGKDNGKWCCKAGCGHLKETEE